MALNFFPDAYRHPTLNQKWLAPNKCVHCKKRVQASLKKHPTLNQSSFSPKTCAHSKTKSCAASLGKRVGRLFGGRLEQVEFSRRRPLHRSSLGSSRRRRFQQAERGHKVETDGGEKQTEMCPTDETDENVPNRSTVVSHTACKGELRRNPRSHS